MGRLFGDRKETYVGTVASRVIPDNLLPNAVKTGLLDALTQGGDIPEYILSNLLSNIGTKVERMYEYARTTYTHGLPSGQVKEATQGRTQMQAVLNTLHGTPVFMEYCHLDKPNPLHIAWMRLIANHGYNAVTNEFPAKTAEKGFPVYLNNMYVTITPDMVDNGPDRFKSQWGLPPSAGYTQLKGTRSAAYLSTIPPSIIEVDPEATAVYVKVEIVWFDGVDHNTELFYIYMDGYDTQSDYFHVKYEVNDVITYMMYRPGTGTYPTLDNVYNLPYESGGSYFPFAYYRFGGVAENTNTSSQAYITGKKLVKTLGIDYDEIIDAIGQNPDIANVTQAMMTMAVPANSTNPTEQRYLFDFFDGLFLSGSTRYTNPTAAFLAGIWLGEHNLMKRVIVIQDARFKMAISNNGIYKRIRHGIIGPVGSHGFEYTVTEVPTPYYDSINGSLIEGYTDVTTHIYKRQVTANRYEEIQVIDLNQMYFVLDTFASTADELDPILLIPLDRDITHAYKASDREELYSRSLHYVFNSVQVIKISWYQTGFFQAVILAAAMYLTIITYGTDGGTLMAAVISGSSIAIQAAVWALLKKLLISLVVGLVLKEIVKEIGAKNAFIIALVLAVAAFYQSDFFSAVASSPWAEQLLSLSSGLAKAAQADLSRLMKDVLEEYSQFNLLKTEKEKALEAANKLLENNNYLNPFVIFGETPDDFYNRTVHSGNIGVLAIDAVSSYVDIALTLPRFDYLLEGPKHEYAG
jgi:hypothetical protein